jgi:hypothetical protein
MNLWADFDNQQQPVEETVRPKQRGRLTEQVILSFLRSWLLQDYVPSYSRALAAMRFYRRCYWIDAWGVNPRLDGQAQAQGHTDTPSSTTTISTAKGRKKEAVQPLLPPVLQPVAALSVLLAQESRAIALYGIALTEGSSTRKDDKARLNKATDIMEDGDKSTTDRNGTLNTLVLPKESGMVGASWLEVGSALLQEINQSPAIFLLNPFGQALFRYENLAPLYQRTAPTELCLLLSHKQIEAQLMAASRSPANASVLTSLLRTDRWKTFVPKNAGAAQSANSVNNANNANNANSVNDLDRVNGLIELLVASMQKHFLSVQRIELPVQTSPAVLEMAPFGLLFATRSKDSLACMNDAVCLYRRRLSRESYAGTLGEEWFMAQQQERDAEALQAMRQRVLQLGRAQRTRRWPDLRQQVLLANFGQWTLHDYDAMIAALLSEGMIRCEWRGRRSLDEGEGTRIPGNEDTLSW